MLIDCPACGRSYHVGPADIEGGRTVICPRCDARWFVDGHATFGGAPERPVPAAEPRLHEPRLHEPRLHEGRRRVPAGATLGLAALALVSLTIGARATLVEMMPRTAALYAAAGLPVNLRGLAFHRVRSMRVDPASPEVIVTGEIRNVAERPVAVPRLAFEVRDAAGKVLIRWSEKAPGKLVASGHALDFASAPHAIPPEASAVLVHFEDGGPG